MTRRSLIGAIRESVVEKPINKQFLQDVMMAIEKKALNNTHNSSQMSKICTSISESIEKTD